MQPPLKLIALSVQNFMRVKSVELHLDAAKHVFVVGGRNEQGKSSTLNALAAAVGGAANTPPRPIRQGQESAEIVADFGEFTVTKIFREGKRPTLRVKSADGAVYPSSQAMLEAFYSKFTFDPLEFKRLPAQKQLELCRQLLGIDFTELDEQRQAVYARRTDVNRELSSLEKRIGAMPRFEGTPSTEISIADLLNERDRRQARNREHDAEREKLAALKQRLATQEANVADQVGVISTLEDQLASARRELDLRKSMRFQHASEVSDQASRVDVLVDEDLTVIEQKLAGAEDTNRKVRANKDITNMTAELQERRSVSAKLTDEIKAIDARKEASLAEAKFPVPGLAFTETGVTFDDIPFVQLGDSKQLRVSVAMGLALHKRLRVLLIRNGSLLDDANLAMIAEMARDADAQVIVERVGEGEEVTVVIEDGSVKEG